MSKTHTSVDHRGVRAIAGTANFREIGPPGRVRPGVAWRADALSDLGDEGRAGLRDLGLRTVVDLRLPIEREQHPDDLAGLDVDVLAVDVIADGVQVASVVSLASLYEQIVDHRGAALAEVVRIVAEPSRHPVVVHCSAGKDRTGLISALVLELLGVPRDEIAVDYARTSELLRGPVHDRVVRRAVEARLSEQQIAVAMDSPAEAILAVLEHLDRRYSGPQAYLAQHGVTDRDVETLRRTLLPDGRS